MQCVVARCGRALKQGQPKYCSMCEREMVRYEAAVSRAVGGLEAYVVTRHVRVMSISDLVQLTGLSFDEVMEEVTRLDLRYEYERCAVYTAHELRSRDIIALLQVVDGMRARNGVKMPKPVAATTMTLAEACKYMGLKESQLRGLIVVAGIKYQTQRPRITLLESDVRELARRIIYEELRVNDEVFAAVLEHADLRE